MSSFMCVGKLNYYSKNHLGCHIYESVLPQLIETQMKKHRASNYLQVKTWSTKQSSFSQYALVGCTLALV